jgi:hypothetical protein
MASRRRYRRLVTALRRALAAAANLSSSMNNDPALWEVQLRIFDILLIFTVPPDAGQCQGGGKRALFLADFRYLPNGDRNEVGHARRRTCGVSAAQRSQSWCCDRLQENAADFKKKAVRS